VKKGCTDAGLLGFMCATVGVRWVPCAVHFEWKRKLILPLLSDNITQGTPGMSYSLPSRDLIAGEHFSSL
jgi:hypothetical protein